MISTLLYYLAAFLAVAVVLSLHEFAHAFVAYRCGDPTPKWERRLTLNPMRHFDLAGLLCFVFVGFGWAKPVAINSNNFKKYRLGCGLTASAGIIVNYLSAFLLYPLFMLVFRYHIGTYTYFSSFLCNVFELLYAYSLSFCVFNLLPFYPLDGFRIVEAASKWRGKVYRFLRQYGYYILLFLIAESFICNIFVDYFGVYQMGYLNILGYFMSFATTYVGYPIYALWGLVF